MALNPATFPPPGAEDLKPLAAFVRRAAELDGREPVMAYYCRYHALRLGMERRTAANKAAVQPVLLALMGRLEEQKEALAGNEAVADDAVGKEYVRNFALKVFLKADNEDRAGAASAKTARTFLAAANFLELLKVFGELEPDTNEKIKYAKWKATDIIRAEKEGRVPQPGPPGGEPGFAGAGHGGQADDDGGSGGGSTAMPAAVGGGTTYGLDPFAPAPSQPPFSQPPSQSVEPLFPQAPFGQPQQPFSQPPAPSSQQPFSQPPFSPHYPQQPFSQPQQPFSQPPAAPQYPQQPQQPHAQLRKPSPAPPQQYDPLEDDDLDMPKYDPVAISNAQKYARFAISALQYEDVQTAIDNLQKSLGMLTAMDAALPTKRR